MSHTSTNHQGTFTDTIDYFDHWSQTDPIPDKNKTDRSDKSTKSNKCYDD